MTDDLQFQEQTFDAGEVTINYAENEDENGGTPLLLLYSVTFSWRSGFDKLLPALAQSRHTYAPGPSRARGFRARVLLSHDRLREGL